MASKLVDTITSNEEYVRLRIFEGDLQISQAGEELLRTERAQHDATRRELARAYNKIAELRKFQVDGDIKEWVT
jgi:hypothetical protein